MGHKSYKWSPKWVPASDGKSHACPMFTARSRESVLLGQRKVDNKVDFLLICICEESHFSMNILEILCGL